MYEDELIPLFEKCGAVWDLRLMMDPMTGTNRGYAFVTFTSREAASNAVEQVSSFSKNYFFTLQTHMEHPMKMNFSIYISTTKFIKLFIIVAYIKTYRYKYFCYMIKTLNNCKNI